MRIQSLLAGPLIAALAAVAACGSDSTAPSNPNPPAGTTTELLTVSPHGGATGVPVNGSMTMTFSQPMMAGMEQYMDLHQGDTTGPLVPITCAWSADHLTATCAPTEPLQHNTTYTLHMGAGMMDAADHPVDMGQHMTQNGGQWLMPGGMMGGDMHAGSPMSGMGAGWMGTNGSYGMVFPFTTG
jgi:Big-like domain-containing protein